MGRGTRHARNALDANPRDVRTREIRGSCEVVDRPGFFIPAFSVRRALVPNDAAKEFEQKLAEYCAKKPYTPYPLDKMGITIVDKSRLVGVFDRAYVHPDDADMLDMAVNVREALSNTVKSKPRKLPVLIASLFVFGNRDNKIASSVEGWKGFSKRYARRDDKGKPLANHQLSREINASHGEIANFIEGGIDGNGNYVDISTRALKRQTPHFTFAEKQRGSISNDERATIHGEVIGFLPEELSFFDPVVHLQLVTPGTETSPITNNVSEADIATAGLFVRRPQFHRFGEEQVVQKAVTAA